MNTRYWRKMAALVCVMLTLFILPIRAETPDVIFQVELISGNEGDWIPAGTQFQLHVSTNAIAEISMMELKLRYNSQQMMPINAVSEGFLSEFSLNTVNIAPVEPDSAGGTYGEVWITGVNLQNCDAADGEVIATITFQAQQDLSTDALLCCYQTPKAGKNPSSLQELSAMCYDGGLHLLGTTAPPTTTTTFATTTTTTSSTTSSTASTISTTAATTGSSMTSATTQNAAEQGMNRLSGSVSTIVEISISAGVVLLLVAAGVVLWILKRKKGETSRDDATIVVDVPQDADGNDEASLSDETELVVEDPIDTQDATSSKDGEEPPSSDNTAVNPHDEEAEETPTESENNDSAVSDEGEPMP